MIKTVKKGFTLIEALVTISVLVIVVGMTTVVISNMVRIQNASSTQYEANEEIYKAFKVTDEFVSFISVNDSDLSFTYDSNTSTSITFNCDAYKFSLRYLNNNLSYSCDSSYIGDNEYLKTQNSVELKNVDLLTYSYYDDVKMLIMDIKVLGKYSREVFTLRTL